MRPRQWIKNLLVFAALVFAEKLGEPRAIALSLAAFAIFCALSGAAYLWNDVLDRERDRLHPSKRERPVASGRLRPSTAVATGVGLAAVALAASSLLGGTFLFVALFFVGLQVTYSGGLKHAPLLDVFLVAASFVVRAAAGGAALQVRVSPWLLVCTFFLALLLALGKRRREIVLLGEAAGDHRHALGEIEAAFVDHLMTIVTPCAILAYSLYTISSEHPPALVYTIPLAVYGIFRYLFLVRVRGLGGDPTELFWKDPPLQIDIFLWIVVVGLLLYVG